MRHFRYRFRTFVLATSMLALVAISPAPAESPPSQPSAMQASSIQALPAQWTEFGGPNRDFGSSIDLAASGNRTAGVAAAWGELGPRMLWHRQIGPGYSAIVSDGTRLYTMTRDGDTEAILALSPDDGRELWRHSYAAPTGMLVAVDKSYGDAPQATPLVAAGRVYGFGFTSILTAVDAASGEKIWSRDLLYQDRAAVPYFGHAASPIRVGETVVVLAGGAHAFDLETGEVRWQNREFDTSYASPIRVDGPDGQQLVIGGAGEVVGLDPSDGRLLWRHEHANQHRTILSTPVAGPDHRVFVSAYFLGSIGLELGAEGQVSELWQREDVQLSHSNAIRVGDMIVGSHNRNLVAIDLVTGEELWRNKGFGRSNLVRVGDRVLLLDDRGRLTLAEMDREGFEPSAHAPILEGRSWTAPTVIGDRLYARNGTSVVAVEWAKPAGSPAETLAGLRPQQGPLLPTRAPAEFLQAKDRALLALGSGDRKRMEGAIAELGAWVENDGMAALAQYYRGLLGWRLSQGGERAERLGWTDRAVEWLEAAVDLQPDFVDARAILGSLYPAYYRLAPAKGGAVGPLGDEHLARARELEPENPRLLMVSALDLIHSPPMYGGDPDAGMALFGTAIARIDAESRAPEDPRPAWGRGLIRLLYARQLAERGASTEARRLAREALDQSPDLEIARLFLESLGEG